MSRVLLYYVRGEGETDRFHHSLRISDSNNHERRREGQRNCLLRSASSTLLWHFSRRRQLLSSCSCTAITTSGCRFSSARSSAGLLWWPPILSPRISSYSRYKLRFLLMEIGLIIAFCAWFCLTNHGLSW